jgi:hypothetical protein
MLVFKHRYTVKTVCVVAILVRLLPEKEFEIFSYKFIFSYLTTYIC